ncbi:MAG: hypothetical protein R3D63_16820 [Paracoccaceae bacterium]
MWAVLAAVALALALWPALPEAAVAAEAMVLPMGPAISRFTAWLTDSATGAGQFQGPDPRPGGGDRGAL